MRPAAAASRCRAAPGPAAGPGAGGSTWRRSRAGWHRSGRKPRAAHPARACARDPPLRSATGHARSA
ncbi:MAG: hypothetical protein EYC70_00765 [Planctomycetota bacterium]|nr:MAG: hypothetical protein EYC70_00765 [Planctomycetota bacterium]